MSRKYYSGRYKLDKYELLSAIYYALNYKRWSEESGVIDDEMQRERIQKRLSKIEESAREADREIYNWLLEGVTDEQVTFEYLQTVKGLPCGRNRYNASKRRFYFLLSQRI